MRRWPIITVLLVGVLSSVTYARGGLRFGHGGVYVAPPVIPITGISYTSPFRYLDNYSAKYVQGDTWFSTLGDDGNTYIACDDCTLAYPPNTSGGGNFVLNTITPFSSVSPSSTTVAVYPGGNPFTSWGAFNTAGSDGLTWKSTGIACFVIGGNPYYYFNLRRLNPTTWAMSTGQTIKSHDRGATWNPTPSGSQSGANQNPFASPMFTGQVMPTDFVQYDGACNSGNGPDGSDTYVYVNIEDWSAGGSSSSASSSRYLARIAKTVFDNLNLGDWQYYTGLDGSNNPTWGTSLALAAKIMAPTYSPSPKNVGVIGGSVHYLSRYQQYIYFGGGQDDCTTSCATATTTAFVAPKPWGPWTVIAGSQINTVLPQFFGWPNVVGGSATSGGQTFTLSMSGDPSGYSSGPSSSTNWYTIVLRTATVSP